MTYAYIVSIRAAQPWTANQPYIAHLHDGARAAEEALLEVLARGVDQVEHRVGVALHRGREHVHVVLVAQPLHTGTCRRQGSGEGAA